MADIEAKKIVTNNHKRNSNYLAFDYVMNIYRGCPHGCVYCYLRSDYYAKLLKPGDDFARVRVKKDALRIIRDDLLAKVKKGIVFTGGTSDAYNPHEAELKLTRNALELLNALGFGVCITTKSDLVTRDADIISDIKTHSPANVNFSITCADDALCAKIEPNVCRTGERLRAVEQLAKRGIITGAMMDPVLPYITDTGHNVRELVKKAKAAGAAFMYAATEVTMADGQREYFYRELDKHFPGLADKYRARFKHYYHCRSANGKRLWHIFAEACEKEGLCYDMRAANFRIRQGYEGLGVGDRHDL